MGARHPDVHVYCSCGAQWHGRYAVDNPVIDIHARREPLVTHEAFTAQFKCLCAPCVAARQAARAAKRAEKRVGPGTPNDLLIGPGVTPFYKKGVH